MVRALGCGPGYGGSNPLDHPMVYEQQIVSGLIVTQLLAGANLVLHPIFLDISVNVLYTVSVTR